jgi:hypothetical protein
MAGELTTILPDIVKALSAGVLGLAIYIWHQREKSVDVLEEDLENDRKVNEQRIKDVYKKIETVVRCRDTQVAEMERRIESHISEVSGRLSTLIGEHNATHKGGRP